MSQKKKSQGKVNEYHIPTQLLYGEAVTSAWNYSHHVIPPITTSSSFRLGSAARGAKGFGEIGQFKDISSSQIYVYDRMGEPTVDMLQNALATAEGGEIAVTYATGMAAIHAAIMSNIEEGDEIICHSMVYGCTYSLLLNWISKLGIKVHFCNLTDPKKLESLLNDKTRIVYLESPVNPTLELLDTEAITKIVNKRNLKRGKRKILTLFDNTFSTPFGQRPLLHGVDIVIHSLTKGICGFGTDMGGAVITRKEFFEKLVIFRKDFGSVLAPATAWHILVYGISTLHLRLPYQQQNASQIAEYLSNHKKVSKVLYPGLSSFPYFKTAKRLLKNYQGDFSPGFMIYFSLKGKSPEDSKRKGEKMMDFIAKNAYCITLAVSLGQLRTLIEHPGSMTHAAYPAKEQLDKGIDPGGIRLAVGVESVEDIIKDIGKALDEV
jgi:methionine-gamma-lyase